MRVRVQVFGSVLLLVAAASAVAQQEGEGAPAAREPAEEPVEDPVGARRGRARADILPRVDELIARFDCLACHDPESLARRRLDPLLAPQLAGVTRRVDSDWLVAFLQDPRAVRPSTTHPDQLALLPEAGRGLVAEAIAEYLAMRDAKRGGDAAPVPEVETSNVDEVERGRTLFHKVGCVACHGPQWDGYNLDWSLVELAEQTSLEDVTNGLEDMAAQGGSADGVGGMTTQNFFDSDLPPVREGIFELDHLALPSDLDRKYRLSTLAAFLVDPVAVRPSGHCPSKSHEPLEARAIAANLLRAQAQRADGTFERRPGLSVSSFEGAFGRGGLALMDQITAVKTAVVTTIDLAEATREEQFGLRFSGFLDVPSDGKYTFHLRSDDGSRLRIGSAVVVDNGGTHAPQSKFGVVELLAGATPFELAFFESGGGEELSLTWEGPGIERGPIPGTAFSHWPLEYRVIAMDGSKPDAAATTGRRKSDAIQRGEQAFARLGCATCHADVLTGPAPETGREALSLERMSNVRPGILVCLRPDGRYDFDPTTVGELLSTFLQPAKIAANATAPTVAAQRRLLGRRCYSCHRRDDLGGVHPDVAEFFTGDEDAELGDQGRFPPTLTAVGRKFRPTVLREALRGEEHVRPYLNTRMPRMGERAAAGFAELLETVDGATATAGAGARADVTTIDDGRRLAGDRGGLGCVQCHNFLGTESLGVRAIDMREMHRRLRFDWFRELLLDPANVDLNARMANLWVDGESPITDIAGGSIDAQIASLWAWLGEGEAMAPPPGLDTGPWAYEIDASQRVRTISVFMKDVSPRVLCVGTPASVHFAFDEQNVRLVKAWRGRFLNVEGTWKGRAGALESPASSDTVDLPAGLAILPLDDLYAAWPTTAGREMSARNVGRTMNDDGSITFRYAIGDLQVEETVAPTRIEVSAGGGDKPVSRFGIERRFVVRAPAGGVGGGVVARVALGRQFDRVGPGRWRIDGQDWPLIEIDESSARSARILAPKRLGSKLPAEEDLDKTAADRPAIDGRDRGASRSLSSQESERVLDELRIPVLMRPSNDGTNTLVGTFSWRYAW